MITQLPIANGFYVAESLPLSAQECINWYPNVAEVPSMSQESLYGTPGIRQVATSGSETVDANRGARKLDGIPYFVNRNTLYRLNEDHTLTDLGAISGTGRVFMADNGTQLVILVPGGSGYVYEAIGGLAEITDPDFRANGNPTSVVFVDGYFVFTTDEKKFVLSAINDGTSYNAVDFGSAESSPDGTVTGIVFKNQLFIVGERSTEAFNNIGDVSFPFERSGLFLDEGTLAPFSVVPATETFMFLGLGVNEEPAIYQFSGNGTQRISTQAIDRILSRLTDEELAAVYGFSYSQAGHFFVGFTLPDTTVVFDTYTGRWHERRSEYIATDGFVRKIAWRAASIVSAFGNLYVGDSVDGRIGILDLDTYDEYSNEMRRVFATQPFLNNLKPFFVPYLELVVESGVGNGVEDPTIRMQRSLDGGHTFQDHRDRPIGKIGRYQDRVIWRRLGRVSRFDVYRFTLSDPVKPVAIALFADIRDSHSAAA